MWIFLIIILIHWISDFVLQPRIMGENKSKSFAWLGLHCLVYTFVTIIGWGLFVDFTIQTLYTSAYLIYSTHYLTDYISSNMTTSLAKKKRWYLFFTTIGFDQVLHYTQLFLIYNYIILNI